jgi:hypothetical protein
MPTPSMTATSHENSADDGAPEDGANEDEDQPQAPARRCRFLPLALTLLTACGDGRGTVTMTETAGPAGVSTAATTTALGPELAEGDRPKATTTKTVTSRSTTRGRARPNPPPGRGVLSGTRAVVIVPVPSFESVLAIDSDGRLGFTDAEADFFVFTPIGRRFQIRTDGIAANTGEPACLRIKSNGSQSLTVVGALCDAGDDRQLFDVAA